ncbi:MAG: Eco29kI family restriction endonuclease [Jatrophihabitantaceae bacterium]
MTAPYNPLALDNLAASIGAALLVTDPSPLDSIANLRFPGAGIYALYYVGGFEPYQLMTRANIDGEWRQPIYVGKAVPKGARKGLVKPAQVMARPVESVSLASRLKQHRTSVVAAENLNIEDFWCRWLVIEPIWIPLGESLLINDYMPVWNTVVDGFGNHDPGAGRRVGMRSRWDVLHPGRSYVVRLGLRVETADHISQEAAEYLRARLES